MMNFRSCVCKKRSKIYTELSPLLWYSILLRTVSYLKTGVIVTGFVDR